MIKRILDIAIPQGQSVFLWGARQAGKSSYLKATYNKSIYYDLLNTHELIRLIKSPYLLREELIAADPNQLKWPVIIDEIQKVPELLNEIHWLIENAHIQFILCGSSVRQLKTYSTNLLGGRAWPYHFYPFVYSEIPQFDLYRALSHGLIPKHYLAEADHIQSYLEAYVETYLAEEIRNEGIVRNLNGFARFLEVAGMSNGEMINLSNIARDCGVNRLTVQGYYQILIDTLIGYFIYPYNKKVKRDLILATPKFYLFDVGIANYLAMQTVTNLKGANAGKAFEHFILMELIAYRGLRRNRFDITYWRTKTGFEVDFILGKKATLAIEVKIAEQVHQADLKGLIAFCEEHPKTQGIVISQDKRVRKLEINKKISILIYPWRTFLKKLWSGEWEEL
jgi:predicted AAA+ superfamily ATPase